MATQGVTVGTVLAIVIMGTVASVLGVLVSTRTISNTLNVTTVGVGVYWDISCTNEVSSINWGDAEPGATMDVTIYVKNEGSVTMRLSMTTESWDPASSSSYITLSWNRENYVLNSGSIVQAVLTLSVSSGISGITSVSFNTILTGTEVT